MKADEPTAPALVRGAQAWNRFWFEPSDPTTLGLIRLLIGLLVLYVHLAYSYDLQEFFGRDAWYSLSSVNRDRQQEPRGRPSTDWAPLRAPPSWGPPEGPDQTPGLLELLPDPVARIHVLEYIRQFPQDEPERSRLLAILKAPRLPDQVDWGKLPPPVAMRDVHVPVAEFIEKLPSDPAERDRIIDYMKEWGTDPRDVRQGAPVWSVWFHVSEPGWMVFVHSLILLIMLLFAVGFCTRVTSVLAWLGALSYIHRSPNTFYGADAMMMVSLLYLMIGPSGSAVSVDRLIARWWARRQARKEGRPEPVQGPPAPSVSATFALRLFQVQFCIIYLAAGTSKLLGGRWWNGQALYYTVANYEFSPVRHEYFQDLLAWLCAHRWLFEVVISGGSWFTIALELSLPFLVWNRKLRMPFVCCALLLHTTIALFMGLVVFSLMMGTMVLAFVPGETTASLLGRGRALLARWWGLPPAAPADVPEEEPTAAPAKKDAERHVKGKHRSRR